MNIIDRALLESRAAEERPEQSQTTVSSGGDPERAVMRRPAAHSDPDLSHLDRKARRGDERDSPRHDG